MCRGLAVLGFPEQGESIFGGLASRLSASKLRNVSHSPLIAREKESGMTFLFHPLFSCPVLDSSRLHLLYREERLQHQDGSCSPALLCHPRLDRGRSISLFRSTLANVQFLPERRRSNRVDLITYSGGISFKFYRLQGRIIRRRGLGNI